MTRALIYIFIAAAWIAGGSPRGTAWADEVQVNTYTTGSQRWTASAMDADGDFVVVWAGLRSPTDPAAWDVLGQRFAADGSPSGGQFRVNSYTGASQLHPAVTMDMEMHPSSPLGALARTGCGKRPPQSMPQHQLLNSACIGAG